MKILFQIILILTRLVASGVACVAVFWVVSLWYFIHTVPENPVKDAVTTDAIVILTGGSDRLPYGFDLGLHKKAKKILVTGVGQGVLLDDLLKETPVTPAQRDQLAAITTLDYVAGDTLGNATQTAQWMQNQNFTSLRLVTANYHMPRSLIIFRRAMPEVKMVMDPVFPEDFHTSSWWRHETSRRLMLSEYHKYLATWLLGYVTA